MSIKSISHAFELSRNTIRSYVRKFQESGIPIEHLLQMSEHHLQEMFVSNSERNRTPSVRRQELDALLPDYAARLSRKGVTLQSLYDEYCREHPDGYRHAQFGNLMNRYMLSTRAVGHVDHYAGDRMYIDYAGDKLEVVDAETGKSFIATALGYEACKNSI